MTTGATQDPITRYFYMEKIAKINLCKPTFICFQIVVLNEDTIVLVDIVLAFSYTATMKAYNVSFFKQSAASDHIFP
jgi:hypothetical protein